MQKRGYAMSAARRVVKCMADKSLSVAMYPCNSGERESLFEFIASNGIQNIIVVKDKAQNPHFLDIESILSLLNAGEASAAAFTSIPYGKHVISLSSKYRDQQVKEGSKVSYIDIHFPQTHLLQPGKTLTTRILFFRTSDLSKDQDTIQKLTCLFKTDWPLLVLQSNSRNSFHNVLLSACAMFKTGVLRNKSISASLSTLAGFLAGHGVPIDRHFYGKAESPGLATNMDMLVQLTSALEKQQELSGKKDVSMSSPAPSPTPMSKSGSEAIVGSESSVATPSSPASLSRVTASDSDEPQAFDPDFVIVDPMMTQQERKAERRNVSNPSPLSDGSSPAASQSGSRSKTPSFFSRASSAISEAGAGASKVIGEALQNLPRFDHRG